MARSRPRSRPNSWLWLWATAAAAALAAATAAADAPVGPCGGGPLLRGDCVWSPAGPPAPFTGVSAPRSVGGGGATVVAPPAVFAGSAAASPGGVTLAGGSVRNVILVGFTLPDPAAAPPGERLRPVGLVAPWRSGGSGLALQDVRILVSPETLRQHLAFFSPGPFNSSSVANTTFVYTDGQSFLHVNSWFDAATTWQSVGLLVAESLADALATSAPPAGGGGKSGGGGGGGESGGEGDGGGGRRRLAQAGGARNYVLAADNATLVPQLLARSGVETPTPVLVCVTTNITLGKPPVPQAGIDVLRPLVVVGLAGRRVSVDLRMQVNQFIMAPAPRFKWGYVTLDSLVVENLGYGDSRSAEIAKPLGVTLPLNAWYMYYDRTTLHNSINNVTYVLRDHSELDYALYWLTVYHSDIPLYQKMASFLRDGLGFTAFELLGQIEPDTLRNIRIHTACVRVDYCNYTIVPQIAPPLPLPPVDPLIKDASGGKSRPQAIPTTTPLVVAISTAAGLKAALADALPETTNGLRDYVIVLRNDVSLAPNASAGWPPPGGQLVPYPVQLLGEGVRPSATSLVHLGFGYARSVLAIPAGAAPDTLTIKRARLSGLPQGPGVAEAAAAAGGGVGAPQMWTLLLWSISSTAANSVHMDHCEVMVPPREFDHLKSLARKGADFEIPLTAGGGSGSGGPGGWPARRLLSLGGGAADFSAIVVRGARSTAGGKALELDGFSAGAVNGTNVTVLPDPLSEAEMPDGHIWRGGASSTRGGSALRAGGSGAAAGGAGRPLPAWAVAVVSMAAALAAAAAVGAALLLYRRRRRAQQQGGKGKPAGGSGPGRPPGSKAASGGGGGGGRNGAAAGCRDAGSGEDWSIALDSGDGCGGSAIGVQVVEDRPLPALPGSSGVGGGALSGAGSGAGAPGSPAPASGGRGAQGSGGGGGSGSLAGSGAGADADRWERVQSAISKMQRQILDRRLRPPRAGGEGGEAAGGADSGPSSGGAGAGGALPDWRMAASAAALASAAPRAAAPAEAPPGGAWPSPAGGAQPGDSALGLAAMQVIPLEFAPGIAPAGAAAAPPLLPLASGGSGGRAPRSGPSVAGGVPGTPAASLQLLDVVGRGTFATVYKAVWRGRFVAVKVLPLQSDFAAALGGAPGDVSFERMAVMEAVVSSTLSHPNILPVFHYFLTPLGAAPRSSPSQQGLLAAAAGSGGDAPRPQSGGWLAAGAEGQDSGRGWELHLIMEYCEEGSLRSALDCGLLADDRGKGGNGNSGGVGGPGMTGLGYALSLAHDVAVAMLHLHSESMIHGDLKASNVLLARATGAAAAAPSPAGRAGAGPGAASACHRFTAKVSDFGLSLHLGPDATHVSRTHAGTVTHMAPELLLAGRASKASDVYSYGILLWELLTGQRAFAGMPVPLLCIKVVKERWRPSWPPGVLPPLRALAEACWSPSAAARPTFAEVASYLEALLADPSLLGCPPACAAPEAPAPEGAAPEAPAGGAAADAAAGAPGGGGPGAPEGVAAAAAAGQGGG